MNGADGRGVDLNEVDVPIGVIGVVLCGGESRRMGTDKGSLQVGDKELVDCSIEALEGVCEEVVLATGREEKYGDRGLRLVLDEVGGRGPLEGIASSLEATKAEWVIVLACDLPRVVSAVPAALLARARAESMDVCLFESRRGREPLVAVYHSAALFPMQTALAEGMRRVDSFYGLPRRDGMNLKVGVLSERDLPEGMREADVACNLNTALELEGERARIEEVVK